MSTQYGKLCSKIIEQFFGDCVQSVVDVLFGSNSKSFPAIAKLTGLNSKELTNVLAILLKFRLIDYDEDVVPTQYTLKKERIIYFIRYPKYLYAIETKFGTIAATILEELFKSGCEKFQCLIDKCLAFNEEKNAQLYTDMLHKMIAENYIISALDENEFEGITSSGSSQDNRFWSVNFDKLNNELMIVILVSAIDNKLGQTAGECFKLILKLINTQRKHKEQSNTFSYVELKVLVENESNNLNLIKYLDNYITLIAEDELRFLRKLSDSGGGHYSVDLKNSLHSLAIINIENIIGEKFGAKASRIFRVIKSKQFIEQEEIQKEAMISAKEAKLLTYNLLQEHFVQLKTIRKIGVGCSGPAKSFFLFYIDSNRTINMLLNVCYQALYNAIIRSMHEKHENRRLIEKAQKLESIVETMKERKETEQYIAEISETLTPPEREILEKVKTRIKALSCAELVLEDTMFLLELIKYADL